MSMSKKVARIAKMAMISSFYTDFFFLEKIDCFGEKMRGKMKMKKFPFLGHDFLS